MSDSRNEPPNPPQPADSLFPGRAAGRAVKSRLKEVSFRDDVVRGRHGDIPIRRYETPLATLGSLVWVHGGAFSGGGLDQHESHAVAAALAQSGTNVITLDYRRVSNWNPLRDVEPRELTGVRYPIPLDDVTDVLEHAIEHGGGEVTLGGASAGACLAAAATLRSLRQGGGHPRSLVLAYGTFHADLPAVSPTLRHRVRGRFGLLQFRRSTVRRMNYNYAGHSSVMSDPFAFPGGHDKKGFPTTLCMDADRDTLRASGERFAEELAEDGVAVEYRVVPETLHGFLDRPHQATFSDGVSIITNWLRAQRPSIE